MRRRKFLLGVGSTAAAGSAILGSGAFSRVDAQRSMTIQVAEDPNAYLGMDKCSIDGSTTPNSSYAHLDDHGHLQILMNEENPTIGESPLGEGINSDSRMWVDNVFQLCNQGKEDICVYIEDHDDWPTAPEAYDEERRVDFYLGGNRESSIVGEDNAVVLSLGECICLGLKTNSKGLSEGDELLEDLDNEIRIVADVDGDCFVPPEVLPECPFYGTTREDPTAINSIVYDADADAIIETPIGDIPDDFPGDSNYPNGVAFDPDQSIWYFAEENGELKTMNEDGALGIVEYGVITPSGEPIAGAAFHDGKYYFIPNGGDTLMTADISGGSASVADVTTLDWSGIGLGDLAIDRDAEILYISTVRSNAGAVFFSVDLNALGDQTLIADGDSSEFAVGKQIAFAEGTLWAHVAGGGQWYTVDVSDGSLSDLVAITDEYTDLAQCGEAVFDPLSDES